MTKSIILNSENPSYDKKTSGDLGEQVSIQLANDYQGEGFVSGLEENDNIYFYDGHLLRNWRDGVQNTLTVESGLRTINITDYFGGETAYPAITLNSNPLPNDLTVKIANDKVFNIPYSCDPNFNEVITGVGYIQGLGEGDKISCESSPQYFFSSEGLEVLDDENDIVIADNTTGQTDKVYVGTSQDDISNKTLSVTEISNFDASGLGYLNYNITGTDNNDNYFGGAGADVISTGAGTDSVNAGDDTAADTIYIDGAGTKIITNAKSADTIKIAIPYQDAFQFYGFSFARGLDDSTSLIINYENEEHPDDNKQIEIKNYFKKVGDDFVMNDDAVKTFTLVGSNVEKTYTLEWRKSLKDGEYHMYNVATTPDEDGFIRGAMHMRNWIDGSEQTGELNLIGDETDDIILGGSGDDLLNGGYGNDYLNGGEGYNIFEFDMNVLAPDSHVTIDNPHLGDIIRFGWNVPRHKATYDFDNNQAVFTFYANIQDEEVDFRTINVKGFDYYDKTNNINEVFIFNGANYTQYIISGDFKFDRTINGNYVKDTPYIENLIVNTTDAITVSGLLEKDNIVFASQEGASTSYTLDENGMTITYGDKSVTISDFDYENDPVNVYIDDKADTNLERLVITGLESFHEERIVTEFTSYDVTTPDRDSYISTGAGDDIINTGAGNDYIESGAGDDYIESGAGTDSVNAGDGDDIIYAGDGNDIIFLDGDGIKTITGGAGENTYYLKRGSAIITDAKDGDMIEFDDFTASNIKFTQGTGANAQDLVISSTVDGNEDSVIIKNYFNMDGSVPDHHINTFIIDKVKYTFEWLEDVNGEYHMYNVVEGDDTPNTLNGIDGIRNWIKGKGENDILSGADDDDVLEGNKGNDTLTGGEGDDTFVFNPGDGNDTITDAQAGDVIVLGKGSAEFSDDMFARSAEEGHTDDLIITYSPSEWANQDTVTIENYFSKAAGLRLSTFVTSDGVSHEYIAADEVITSDGLQDNGGKIDLKKDATGEFKVDGSEYVSPSTKGINVNNKSANAVLDVTGSLYNDTISTSKSTGNNTVVESYGTNKVTTGSGDDFVEADKYSSNTINVGDGDNIVVLDSAGNNKVTAGKGDDRVSVNNYSSNTISVGDGNNEVILDGFGTNKVTAGNDNNTISANTGINTIKLGKGNNEVSLAGGINTVKTGAGNNIMTIGDGINKVTTGKGDDVFTVNDGNNTFNSGASKTAVTYDADEDVFVGGDQYYINGGYNTIKTTGATYVNITDSSTNTITTGGKDDTFEIGGGVNNIKGGAGYDTYIFKALENGESTLITDSKGNDVYDFTEVDDFDGLVAINDKKGNDTIMLADNELKLFCDGTFKYNKSKKTGTFTFGKNVGFAEEISTDITSGIQISGKSVEKLDIKCADNSLYNIDELKSNLTAWFTDHNAYKSVDAVFAGGDMTDITSLLNVYNGVPSNEQPPV